MEELADILVPLGVCVALPVLVVWLVMRAATNSDNKRAEVLIEAIKNNANIDADKLAETFGKKPKRPLEIYQSRLLRGALFTFAGVASAIVACYFGGPQYFNVRTTFIIIAAFTIAIGLAFLIVAKVTHKSLKNSRDENEE